MEESCRLFYLSSDPASPLKYITCFLLLLFLCWFFFNFSVYSKHSSDMGLKCPLASFVRTVLLEGNEGRLYIPKPGYKVGRPCEPLTCRFQALPALICTVPFFSLAERKNNLTSCAKYGLKFPFTRDYSKKRSIFSFESYCCMFHRTISTFLQRI